MSQPPQETASGRSPIVRTDTPHEGTSDPISLNGDLVEAQKKPLGTREQKVRLREQSRTSNRSAITLFCMECMGVGEGGNRADVRDCTATNCALYHRRPFQHVLGKPSDQ